LTNPLLERLLKLQKAITSCEDFPDKFKMGVEELDEFESLKSQLEEKLDISEHTEDNGIKTKRALCIYFPEHDLWVADSYQNLLNLRKIEIEKQAEHEIVERLKAEIESIDKVQHADPQEYNQHCIECSYKQKLQSIIEGSVRVK